MAEQSMKLLPFSEITLSAARLYLLADNIIKLFTIIRKHK